MRKLTCAATPLIALAAPEAQAACETADLSGRVARVFSAPDPG
jgi:hypothetical protein